MVVVGAGFIGAEVAASCRTLGLEVTLVEALPVPLERVLGAEMGAVCGRVHVEHGVDLRLGTGVDRFETVPSDGGRRRVTGVTLTDGTTVEAEVVVVGIGVSVNTGWLEGSGLTLDDGVVCDETLLAAPGVVAAGDIARYPSERFDQLLRVEHWEHAIQGGEAAARRLLAEAAGTEPAPFDPVPWFWSDQYDRKLQLAGRPAPTDEVRVVHGSTEEFRFVALYGREGRLVGVLGMNRPRHVIQLRGLVDDESVVRRGPRAGGGTLMSVPPEEELVDVLDADGNVVGTVTRGEMRASNLWHRSVFVVVVNGSDEILVHKRASWKDKWPDLWDIAVGGVVTAGEAWELAGGPGAGRGGRRVRRARLPGRGRLRRRRRP